MDEKSAKMHRDLFMFQTPRMSTRTDEEVTVKRGLLKVRGKVIEHLISSLDFFFIKIMTLH